MMRAATPMEHFRSRCFSFEACGMLENVGREREGGGAVVYNFSHRQMEQMPFFHLVFRPNIKLVSTVRRFTEEFYRRVLANQDLSQRLALATHELLENAVAYSSDSETAIRIEIEDDVLTVQTWNRSTPERIAGMRTLLDALAAADDPKEFYQDLMNKSLEREDGSGLGLARVRSEAEMLLTHEIDNEDRVCIRARTTIAGGINP